MTTLEWIVILVIVGGYIFVGVILGALNKFGGQNPWWYYIAWPLVVLIDKIDG